MIADYARGFPVQKDARLPAPSVGQAIDAHEILAREHLPAGSLPVEERVIDRATAEPMRRNHKP